MYRWCESFIESIRNDLHKELNKKNIILNLNTTIDYIINRW